MTDTVTLGGWYKHDVTGKVMRVISGSVPQLENHVTLISSEGYAAIAASREQTGFTERWDGTWEEFMKLWSAM